MPAPAGRAANVKLCSTPFGELARCSTNAARLTSTPPSLARRGAARGAESIAAPRCAVAAARESSGPKGCEKRVPAALALAMCVAWLLTHAPDSSRKAKCTCRCSALMSSGAETRVCGGTAALAWAVATTGSGARGGSACCCGLEVPTPQAKPRSPRRSKTRRSKAERVRRGGRIRREYRGLVRSDWPTMRPVRGDRRWWRLFSYGVAVVMVGLFGAGFAIAFRVALGHVITVLYPGAHEGGTSDIVAAFHSLPLLLRIVVPAAGGVVAGFIGIVAAKSAGGHGVAEVMEAVALGRGQPHVRTALLKALSSFAAMTTGGSIGREGPMIQFGSGMGAFFGRTFQVGDARKRALVAAGTAAGFAAAYDTPIAAVLFVLEIVTGILALEVLLPVLAATGVSTFLTRMVLGEVPLYGKQDFVIDSVAELAVCAGVGLLGGLAGAGFMKLLALGERAGERLRFLPRPILGALGGLVVGGIAAFLPEVCGNGADAVPLVIGAKLGAFTLAALLFAKGLATAATVGSGSPGGVFTPSLVVGASLGGVVAAVVHAAWPSHLGESGGYALVGMAAVIASTTHAPLTAAAIVFEFTGDTSLLPPLLLAATLATLVGRRIAPESVYTAELKRRGIPWRGTMSERIARAVRAKDILEMDPPEVRADASVDDALALLEQPMVRAVYVTGDPPVRVIDLHDAKRVWAARARGEKLSIVHAGDLAKDTPQVAPDATLVDLSEALWNQDLGELPVVAKDPEPRLLGVVTRRNVLGAFDREVLQRDVLLTRVVWFEGQTETADYLELPPGERVELIAPPQRLIGQPIDHAALRGDFCLTVLGVRLGDGPRLVEPLPDHRVTRQERWLVKGPPDSIARFRAS